MEMELVQGFAIVAVCGDQEISPERPQVLPPQSQLPAVLRRYSTQLRRTEPSDQRANFRRHPKQQARRSAINTCDMPCESQRLPRELSCVLARKAAVRAWIAPATRAPASRVTPQALILEMKVDQENGKSRRPSTSGRIACAPEASVVAHDLGGSGLPPILGVTYENLEQPLVEAMNEFECVRSHPLGHGQWQARAALGVLGFVGRHVGRSAVRPGHFRR